MATNSVATYVPSIDYTSRDFFSILQDMINLIPNTSPNWTNRDPSDFGITLLELFAYMGDILNYYVDVAANEGFITSAVQRQSVLSLATLLGYTPTDSVASTVTLTFQNSTGSDITLPALTQVATSLVANATTSQILFEANANTATSDGSWTVPANGSVSVPATQGQTISNEIVGTSTNGLYQTYQLANPSVISGSINVTISGVGYQQVQYIIDAGGYDPVYQVFTDANGVTSIEFGDNVSGRVPPSGVPIYATYRIGGGAVGNVAQNTIKYVIKVPGSSSIPAGLTVSNQTGAATGGADPESTDSIRVNAPLSIRSVNRAVSVLDYASLAVQVNGVSKAIATANVYSSVTLYVCPAGDPGVATDNITPTSTFNTITNNVLAYLQDKTPGNTSITFQPPTYVGVYLIVNITVDSKFSQSSVLSNVTAAINTLLSIDNVAFGYPVTVPNVHNAIGAIDGVANQNIIKMVRADKDQSYTVTNKALNSSNVATLTIGTHTLQVGQTVSVTGVDTTFNGTFVVTAITSTTFSYTLVAGAVSSTASSGSITALTVGDIICASNEIPTLNEIGGNSTGVGNLVINLSGGITN